MQAHVIERLHDRDWTFSEASTKYATHGLHKYPARMPPQIPDQILSILRKTGEISDGDFLYDPFVGSGSTTTEAVMHDLHATGNDINPFACLLARAKGTLINPDELAMAHDDFFARVKTELQNIDSTISAEELDIRTDWFPQPQLTKLVRIREVLNSLDFPEDIVRYLRIEFSNILRTISYQRNGEFKRYRMAEEDREEHDPNVLDELDASLDDGHRRMKALQNYIDRSLNLRTYARDSRQADHLPTDYYDVVVTSPPYGDHQTTVAYGEFSRDLSILASDAELDRIKSVDNDGLGGSADPSGPSMEELRSISPTLDATIEALEEKKQKRREEDKTVSDRDEDALKFFQDYYAVLEDTARRLKSGRLSAWVIANRTMRRVAIPTNIITEEFGEHIGYDVHEMLKRDIPNRTLPSKNAPENIPDQKGGMMVKESIALMSAP